LLYITDCRSAEGQFCGEDEAVAELAEEVCIAHRLLNTCSLVSPAGLLCQLLAWAENERNQLMLDASERESGVLRFIQPFESWRGKVFIPRQATPHQCLASISETNAFCSTTRNYQIQSSNEELPVEYSPNLPLPLPY